MEAALAGWAAGLIDGEGCLLVTQQASRPSPILPLRVEITSRATCYALQKILGGAVRARKTQRPLATMRAWFWEVYAHDAARVLACLEPYMLTKKCELRACKPAIDLLLARGRGERYTLAERSALLTAKRKLARIRKRRQEQAARYWGRRALP